MIVITTGIAVARGVGGRRGRARDRASDLAIDRWLAADMAVSYLPRHALRYLAREASAGDLRPWLPDDMPVLAVPPGYRERRRLAKLRRRARDRDVARTLSATPWGSDVFAAYKAHIQAALATVGRQ